MGDRLIQKGASLVQWILAIGYSLHLSGLPSKLFKDRNNYSRYARKSDEYIELFSETPFFLFKEPLFLYLNKWLEILGDTQTTIRIFVFFSCFSLMLFMLKASKGLWAFIAFSLLIFFNPQTFALQLVTFRQGMALGVILLFLTFHKRFLNYGTLSIVTLLMGFIHISFFIVSFFLVIDLLFRILNKNCTLYQRLFVQFFVALILGFIVLQLSALLGAKEQYADTDIKTGGGAFVLWFVVLMYLLLFRPKKYEIVVENYIYFIAVSGLCIYLCLYFTTPVAGRLIGTYVPFVIYMLLWKSKVIDIVFNCTLILVFMFLFFNGGSGAFLNVELKTFLEHLF